MAKRSAASAKPHPISLAELARRSGKHRSSITRQIQGSLRAALLADGRVDAAHDAVAAWARGHGIDPRALVAGDPIADAGSRSRADAQPKPAAKRRARPDRATASDPESEAQDDGAPTDEDEKLEAATIGRVGQMTLAFVAERYINQTRFADVLKNVKTAEEIRYKFLDNEEQEGRLLPRDFVQSRIFAVFDELFRKLLDDFPKTITSELYPLGRADEGNEKGEAIARDLLSAQIRAIKERMLHDFRGV